MRKWSVVISIAMGAVALFAVPARAQQAQSLVYAVYDNESGAMNAYKSLEQAERNQVVRMQSWAVLSKDAKGKVHIQRSNQKEGTIAGAIIGGLIGALGGPAGAAVGAGLGGGAGFAAGEAVGIRTEDIKAIRDTLTPGSSALVAVLDERWAGDLARSVQQTEARRVLQTKLESGQFGAQPSTSTPQQQQSPTQQPQQ